MSPSRSESMLLRRALFAEAQLGVHDRDIGRYVLHRCPNCNHVTSTPSVCADDGSPSVPEPRSTMANPAEFMAGGGQFIPRLPDMTDEEWAQYIEQEIAARWGS